MGTAESAESAKEVGSVEEVLGELSEAVAVETAEAVSEIAVEAVEAANDRAAEAETVAALVANAAVEHYLDARMNALETEARNEWQAVLERLTRLETEVALLMNPPPPPVTLEVEMPASTLSSPPPSANPIPQPPASVEPVASEAVPLAPETSQKRKRRWM